MSSIVIPKFNNLHVEDELFFSEEKGDKHLYMRVRKFTKICVFVMMNPTFKDGEEEIPTLKVCEKITEDQGARGFIAVNLFSYITDNIEALEKHVEDNNAKNDIIGQENNKYLFRALTHPKALIIAAWGDNDKREKVLGIKDQIDNFNTIIKFLEEQKVQLSIVRLEKEGYEDKDKYKYKDKVAHPIWLVDKKNNIDDEVKKVIEGEAYSLKEYPLPTS